MEAVTLDTVGAVVSTMIAFAFPREFAAPGVARVRVASFPAKSLIEPPFVESAVVDA